MSFLFSNHIWCNKKASQNERPVFSKQSDQGLIDLMLPVAIQVHRFQVAEFINRERA
jgi:hypothetical protein